MEFITQMRCFEKLSAENLTPNAIAIYWKLFMINNNTGWKEWFEESDYWLGRAVGIKRHETILAALNLLKQKGFIEFERGTKRNQPTRYKIIVLNNSTKDSTEPSTKPSTKDSTISSTEPSTKPSDTLRYKTKNKDIDNVVSQVVEYLNEAAGTRYRTTSGKTVSHIHARINEGFSLDDFKTVIDSKVSAWINDEKMKAYIRPETLFGTKFESYLNAAQMSCNSVKFDEEDDYDDAFGC